MIVDETVYLPRRFAPHWLLRLMGRRALISTSAPYHPRVGEKRHSGIVRSTCPNCNAVVMLGDTYSTAPTPEDKERTRLIEEMKRRDRRRNCRHLRTHHEGSLGYFCSDCGVPV